VKTLLLTEKEVKTLLSMDEVMKSVELAFKEKGLRRAQMPPKPYLFYNEYNGDLRVMPSYLEELDISAVKVVNSHQENRTRHGLPTVMATIILVNPKNGFPLAIMGGTHITDMRTGAAGGVAAKYLARKDAGVVGLIGAGAQAKTQLMALVAFYEKIEEVRVWSRTEKTRDVFVAEMEPLIGKVVGIVPAKSAKSAVEEADIIVTTTPSREYIVSDKWVAPGTHFNCIGADAPGKEELDPDILKRSKIFVDDWEQASHSGEINVPLKKGIITKQNVLGEICEVVAGLKPGRTSSEEITVFSSTGLAVQDAVTANLAYQKALAKGLGELIEIV
jgi:alanine dehydrogenase